MREKPPSSKNRAKAEASAPSGETPMTRFRRLAAQVLEVDPAKVRALEEKERTARRRRKEKA